jgi:hypothetical protein
MTSCDLYLVFGSQNVFQSALRGRAGDYIYVTWRSFKLRWSLMGQPTPAWAISLDGVLTRHFQANARRCAMTNNYLSCMHLLVYGWVSYSSKVLTRS